VNEIISTFLNRYQIGNALNTNIYSLLESLLITFQFRNWGLFRKNKNGYLVLLSFFTLAWGIEVLMIGSIHQFISYYNIIYSFVIVIMSIQMMNRMLMSTTKSLLLNPVFLICGG